MSALNDGYSLIEGRDVLFTLLGIFVTLYALGELDRSHLSPPSPTPLDTQRSLIKIRFNVNFNVLLPVLFVITPFILFATESLILLPIPHLLFSLNDNTSLYSQGTTAYFAIGSIVFIFLSVTAKNFPKRITLLFLSLVMIFLSALGGARGDFLVGVIVVLLIIIRFKPFKIGALIFLPLFLLSLSYLNIFADDFVILRRLSVLGDGNFGLRDVLLYQSIDLLAEELKCLIMGCGFNYFQIYYGYNYGMYPHNIFAEALITYGIFIGVPLVWLVIVGMVYGFFSYHRYFVYWVLLYFIGIGLKSGSLLGYTSTATLVFFAYLGLSYSRKLYIQLNTRTSDV